MGVLRILVFYYFGEQVKADAKSVINREIRRGSFFGQAFRSNYF